MHQIEQRKLPNCTKGKINHGINATFQVMPISKNITDRNDGKIISEKSANHLQGKLLSFKRDP